MSEIIRIATNISDPLMLAGLLAAVFFLIVRSLIKANVFPTLGHARELLLVIVNRFFVLALVAMVLGFLGFVVELLKPGNHGTNKDHYAQPAADLLKLRLEEVSAVDLMPRPETKNISLRYKVISNIKDKYVPLDQKGEFVVIDSAGTHKVYTFQVHADEEGVKPQVVSHIILDGLIPRQDYEQILSRGNYKGRCIFYYDKDVAATDVRFVTDVFELTKERIRQF